MIVCLCKGVSDRAVDAAIAGGAETVGAIGRACGAGTVCGGCVCALKSRLAGALARSARTDSPTLPDSPSITPPTLPLKGFPSP